MGLIPSGSTPPLPAFAVPHKRRRLLIPALRRLLKPTPDLCAYSGERDQPFWLMVITCFGDRDHARRGGVGPWRTAASDASAGGYSLVVSGGTGQGRAGG